MQETTLKENTSQSKKKNLNSNLSKPNRNHQKTLHLGNNHDQNEQTNLNGSDICWRIPGSKNIVHGSPPTIYKTYLYHNYTIVLVCCQNGDKQGRQFVSFFGSFEIQNQLVATHHVPNVVPNFEGELAPKAAQNRPTNRVLGGTTQPIWKEFAYNSHQCNPVHHHTKTPSLPSTFPVLWPKWLSCQLSRTKKCIRRTLWNFYNFYKSWHRFMHWNLIYESIEYANKIYGPKGFGASDWYRSEMWIWKHTKITHDAIDGNSNRKYSMQKHIFYMHHDFAKLLWNLEGLDHKGGESHLAHELLQQLQNQHKTQDSSWLVTISYQHFYFS